MFDRDGEGRQLDGYDASDTHTLRRTFVTGDWSQTFSVTENLFYSDNVLAKIADFTNVSARNKFNRAEGQGQGVTVYNWPT